MAKQNNAKKPLAILPRRKQDGGETYWLSGNLLTAAQNKYESDVEAAQRCADWYVDQGMVKVPEGMRLKAVWMNRWGGKLGMLAVPESDQGNSRTATIDGMPD